MIPQEIVRWYKRVIPPEQIIRSAPHMACLSLALGYLLMLWEPIPVSHEKFIAGMFLLIAWLWLVVIPWRMRQRIRSRDNRTA